MFEISSLDLEHLTVTFEMLYDDLVATVELDLSNISSLKCSVFSSSAASPICSDELASKIIQK